MVKPPPDWRQIFNDHEGLLKLVSSEQLGDLLEKANTEYLHWDKFRYQPMPSGITAATAWGYLKMVRRGSQEKIPIINEYGSNLSVYLGKN